jgi:hypothetical protein
MDTAAAVMEAYHGDPSVNGESVLQQNMRKIGTTTLKPHLAGSKENSVCQRSCVATRAEMDRGLVQGIEV